MTTENSTPMYMPVAPAYGNGGGFGGFGGDGWWILLLLLCGWGGMGFGGMGGWGGMNLSYDFPWLLQGQNGINANTNAGFDRAAIQGAIGDLGAAVNGINQQLYANEIASLNRSFDAQSAVTTGFNAVQGQLAQCCCDNRLATCQTQNIVQVEAAATRAAGTDNTQKILDKLCQLELDGVRGQLAQAQRENVGLQNALNMATMRESQTEQNAFISKGFSDEVDALYNRLSNCPVPTTPVYGRTPIFTCGGNGGCGCGNGFMN